MIFIKRCWRTIISVFLSAVRLSFCLYPKRAAKKMLNPFGLFMTYKTNSMKKVLIITMIVCVMFVPVKAGAQSAEIQQLILNIEKLSQFKKILSDMKKGYELLSGGYKSVKDMTEGNFSLHKTFLDALMQVSPTVK